MNFKDIHIGSLISQKVTESGIEISRICNFIKSTEQEITQMYEAKSLDCEILLRWSKLLEYDFFRIYSQHLILYSPLSKSDNINKSTSSKLPKFRKNIYTKDIINFILELIESKEKTTQQIINEYNIPKTTLYIWIKKYRN
ncbi:transposase [Chryseobacterium formosense]|uniref:Transposase n=1 Tax=Chryseobacterium formosense TaxID=236814 RepID=A0A085YYD1_9FLAO|nr:transposase [Chryseobacterium formosense]